MRFPAPPLPRYRGNRPCSIAFACALWTIAAPVLADQPQSVDYFETHIRPLLIEACVECHGESEQSGNLRLDSPEHALRGGDSGKAILPGDPDRSLILRAVKREGDLQMPPDQPLSRSQIDKLEHWIATGASWPKTDKPAEVMAKPHWAFEPVQQPTIPTIASEQMPDADWVQTPIDAFVLRKLLANGLRPSPKADRRTLIRRATFDLTGLPPTPEEVDAFIQDDADEAWPRLIHRLLDSPHYGEKWGRHWLDVARYSDSKGYVYAREERFWVHAWAYRDWVVKALNDDMPYDRFLLLQIAADQAECDQAECDQAECDQEDLAAMGFLTLGRRFLGVPHDIIDDRIDVLTRGTMGLTVACARCHNHKYDPIPTEDYYSLYGVFRNCDERLVPLTETEDNESEFAKGLKERTAKLDETMAKHRTAAANRVRDRLADYLIAQLHLADYPEAGFDQIYLESDIIPEFVRHWRDYLDHQAEIHDTVFEAWRRFQSLPSEDFESQSAALSRAIQNAAADEIHPRVAALFSEPPQTMESVAARYGELFAEVDAQWKAKEQSDVSKLNDDPLLQVLYGKGSPCEVPDEPIVNIERFFPSNHTEELWKLQGDIDRWLMNTAGSTPHALILVDKDAPASDARVMHRGDPRLLGERVPRQFLSCFKASETQPFQQGSGRLELARAIISPDNPLTARVAVNRIWMHHFGVGLVTTPSDFGRRADPPTHPDLLDWLSASLIENGWQLKQLHRMIMLSSTYQQSSVPATEADFLLAGERDPGNQLLWRVSPRRLTFEELRDTSLAVTGELQTDLGGKPVDLLTSHRRTLYARIDRQFFSSLMRVFDVASPDLHIARRNETTVPQQALFFLNHPFLVQRAKELAKIARVQDETESVRNLYRRVFQREPTEQQIEVALEMIAATSQPETKQPELPTEWSYGYGEYNADQQRVTGFTRLPYFDGKAWQGGPNYPDATLGWVQLTADGGHPGNTKSHACVRRWTAPGKMQIKIESELIHEAKPGDGIRAYLVTSRQGLLKTADAHNATARFDVNSLSVEAGENVDFVVDILEVLNSDQHLWKVSITDQGRAEQENPLVWDSRSDFGGPPTMRLEPWELLAQVLLSANEFTFID